MPNFVTTHGTLFDFPDGRYPFKGVNCYFLAYCSDESRRAAMIAARAMGAHVIRCWAFLDVDHFVSGSVAFQSFEKNKLVIHDGPAGLQRLDALIQAADDLNIRLILPLVNHWSDFGGMPMYVKWMSDSSDVTAFYRSQSIRDAYRNWIGAILTRRNTITGRLYSEEPAIMAWELTNEARCPTSGGRELLLDWTQDMARYVKSLDANHLLALGDEGFFFKKGSGHLYDGTYGVDWEAILAIPEIDFGAYHFYPQDWGHGHQLNFARRWIVDHAETGAKLNKPVVMEEFGLKLDEKHVKTAEHRSRWYREWDETIAATGTAGSLLWMLGHDAPDTSGYVDPYVIHGKVTPG